eukprot:jgi/Tetstr1/440338/TSEL_028674.t1
MWNSRNDEWDRYLTDTKKHATRDEYRHLLCHGAFTASVHAALTDASEDRHYTYLRRFKCKKARTGEKRVAEHSPTEMAAAELTVEPRGRLFRPGRRDGRELLSFAWAPATAAPYANCMKGCPSPAASPPFAASLRHHS